MIPCPKTIPARSERYKKFIRSKPCAKCSTMTHVQAAHMSFGFGGMGTKPSDLWTIPACNNCHFAGHMTGEETFWDGFDLKLECLKLLNEFVSNGGNF